MKNSIVTFAVVAFFFAFLSSYGQTLAIKYGEKSIVESAASSAKFKTLWAAVHAAELEDLLDTDGPFTVFAPSDMAFSKLSKEKIAHLLLPENKNELFSLLTYHIVAGNFSASKILQALSQGNGRTSFTTIQGTEIMASMSGINIVLTDHFGNSATITTADSNQCNGVIHEIDGVFAPNKI